MVITYDSTRIYGGVMAINEIPKKMAEAFAIQQVNSLVPPVYQFGSILVVADEPYEINERKTRRTWWYLFPPDYADRWRFDPGLKNKNVILEMTL